MTLPPLHYEALEPALQPALSRILTQAFNIDAEVLEKEFQVLPHENWRVVREESGRVLGGLGILWFGQWYGGREIPSAGIICVGVSPECRGRGAARFLLSRMLLECRERGFPLSSLYPSNLPTYRKVGYEIAGFRHAFTIDTARIPDFGERSCAIIDAPPDEWAGLEPVLAAVRGRFNARVERTPALWKYRMGMLGKKPVYSFRFEWDGAPEAYVVYEQADGKVNVRDAEASSMRGARALWTFLRDHRSTIREVNWTGHPTSLLLRCMDTGPNSQMRVWPWMLRVVDPAAALAARGYNRAVPGELHLDVVDNTIPELGGRLVLRVEGGVATTTPGGDGTLKVHERALASLYGGALTASQLAWTGGIEGPAADIELADALFAGPQPFINDDF